MNECLLCDPSYSLIIPSSHLCLHFLLMPPFLVFVYLLCKILAELPGHVQIIEANHHHHHLCYCQGDSKVLQRIQRKIKMVLFVCYTRTAQRLLKTGKSKQKLVSRVFL